MHLLASLNEEEFSGRSGNSNNNKIFTAEDAEDAEDCNREETEGNCSVVGRVRLNRDASFRPDATNCNEKRFCY